MKNLACERLGAPLTLHLALGVRSQSCRHRSRTPYLTPGRAVAWRPPTLDQRPPPRSAPRRESRSPGQLRPRQLRPRPPSRRQDTGRVGFIVLHHHRIDDDSSGLAPIDLREVRPRFSVVHILIDTGPDCVAILRRYDAENRIWLVGVRSHIPVRLAETDETGVVNDHVVQVDRSRIRPPVDLPALKCIDPTTLIERDFVAGGVTQIRPLPSQRSPAIPNRPRN